LKGRENYKILFIKGAEKHTLSAMGIAGVLVVAECVWF